MAESDEHVYLGQADQIVREWFDELGNGRRKDVNVAGLFPRFVLELVHVTGASAGQVAAIVDSDVDAGVFDTSLGARKLGMTLGIVLQAKGVAPGTYDSRLVGIDSGGAPHKLLNSAERELECRFVVAQGIAA